MVADFSHFALWLAGLATVAQAYTQPVSSLIHAQVGWRLRQHQFEQRKGHAQFVARTDISPQVGDAPSGNSITKPGLNELVPAGTPYAITWTPTTSKCATVDLILLRGPSENIKYLSTIAEKVDNTGSYSWTPSKSLEPDTTHYGIQLICDESGAYQYTTQFGISNPGYSGSSASASGYGSASASGSDVVTSTRSVHLASSSSSSPSSAYVVPTSFHVPGNSTVAHATGTVSSHGLKTTHKPSTSTEVLTATNNPTVTDSASGKTSAPATATTNGAAAATAAMGFVGAAAAAAMYLL